MSGSVLARSNFAACSPLRDLKTSARPWYIVKRKPRISRQSSPPAISNELAVEFRAVQGASMQILFRAVLPMIALAALAAVPFAATGQQKKPAAPKSVRLYILDCGDITGVGEVQF